MPVDHPTIANVSRTAGRDRDAIRRGPTLSTNNSHIVVSTNVSHITRCKLRGGTTTMTLAALPSRARRARLDRSGQPPQPSTFDRPAHNVSASAVGDRDPPIRDLFPKKNWKGFFRKTAE
jgi:hypothetical protein